MLPLTILGQWWLPKEELTSKAFSSLLQMALAMAFDIAEFTHLVVEEPALHKDQSLLILVLTFTSTSIFLLIQIDVGMASDNTVSEIIWTTLTILFLDGPLLVFESISHQSTAHRTCSLFFFSRICLELYLAATELFRSVEDKESRKDKVDETKAETKNFPVFESRLQTAHTLNDYIVDRHINKLTTGLIDSNKDVTEMDHNDNASVHNSQVSDDREVAISNVAVRSCKRQDPEIDSNEAPSLRDDGDIVVSNKAAMSSANQTSSCTHSDVQKVQQASNKDVDDQQNEDNENVRETGNHFRMFEERHKHDKHRFAQDMKLTADNVRETSSLHAIQEKHHKNLTAKIKTKLKLHTPMTQH